MMRALTTSLILLVGVVVGIGGHVAWQLLTSGVTASGVLQQEGPAPPGVSATFPAGFYVESRVYLRTASSTWLGHDVTVVGRCGRVSDPDAPAYPSIENAELTVLK